MKRIFGAYAYSDAPRDGCWWDETATRPEWPEASGALNADIAVIGAGFTGLSAALHLAEAGANVAVLDAEYPGWGASGRNGGFCCLGGAKIDGETYARIHGEEEARQFHAAEVGAVHLVARLLDRLGIDADTHSKGETQLAHNRRAMERLRRAAETEDGAVLTEAADLAAEGMAGPFHGAMTTPVGFGLNPRKYVLGLARAAAEAGAQIYQQSPAERIERTSSGYRIALPQGELRADMVLLCTNGYSSEDVPEWLAGRYMPAQSTVLVTRPLTEAELSAAGWTSDQMAYDTRNLLHYFRLMPDRRFLFGMRGGLTSTPRSEAAARARTRADFEAMFPAWRGVESAHLWSGMVCLAANRVPFAGPVPGNPGMFAGLAYHGNGVAMGSYTGRLLADLVQGNTPDLPYPAAMNQPMSRFPLGRARRLLMPPLYAGLALGDL